MKTKLEDRAYTAILARERYYEREVQKQLKTALDTIRGKMAAIYARYAVDGQLSKADMTRYNRYATMERDMLAVVNQSTRETLRTIDRLRPEQYGESFFRHAWAVDNTVGVRLAWGKLNRDAVIANLANEFYYISKERYGMEARLLIRSTLAQGVAQGVSYQEMSRQLARALNIVNWRAMRILRTEGQTAVSAGQDAAYIKAQEQGVKGGVVWDATLDMRTRDTHQAMDGQVRGEDGYFNGPGGNKAPFPGFPDLPAEERINCRCRLRFEIEGFEPAIRRTREGGIVPYQTYEEWEKEHATWK
jgi:hypothetical protein